MGASLCLENESEEKSSTLRPLFDESYYERWDARMGIL